MINDSSTNLKEENGQGCSNFRHNLCKYLLQTTSDDYQYSRSGDKKKASSLYNLEQNLKNFEKRMKPDAKNGNGFFLNIDELVPFFIEKCLQEFIDVTPCFASYYLHLLIRDYQNGLKLNEPSEGMSICKIEQFLLTALAKYRNRMDATVNSMKVQFYYVRNRQKLQLEFVKEMYELDFKNKLNQLIRSILQYPETSSDKQLEEMFVKMQVFIITNYKIGHPENHVLLKQCRQSLNSIMGKGDIQKYVLRKRYHRLEYLQKLGATAAGILIFNSQGPQGDKENVRNIFDDLKMARRNTKESIQEGIDRVFYLKQHAFNTMSNLFEIDIQQRKIFYFRPPIHIQEINKFVILFEVYRTKLEEIQAIFEKTQYLIEGDKEKFYCVAGKINEILKYRSAIESEFIFPHFVYLSEIWNSLILYLNHLVEINKAKECLDGFLNEELENTFKNILDDLNNKKKFLEEPLKRSFDEVLNSTTNHKTEFKVSNMKPFVQKYCALTIALTGGLLVPSQLEKSLWENEVYFGFSNEEYAKFFAHHLKLFTKVFRNTVLTCSDLIVLFELDAEIMENDFHLIKKMEAKAKSLDTQTEIILNEKLPKIQIGSSWNVWDIYRQTIKLANIRKTQTHSTQSNLSFGTRNAQNQYESKINDATQK